MFRSFELERLSPHLLQEFEELGETLFENQQRQVKSDLGEYFNKDGELEATKIFYDWFPEVPADVFISHSHADKVQVYALAAFLKQEMGLTAFIDSAVWGYADDLLKQFDDKFCRNSDDSFYVYEKRNISTTHIHLMLNMALLSMMDKAEAVFFYNTPNSVSLKKSVDRGGVGTHSPWIFSEISMTRMLRVKEKIEHRAPVMDSILAMESLKASASMPSIRYPLTLGHLIKMDEDLFTSWAIKVLQTKSKGSDALERLYELAGVA